MSTNSKKNLISFNLKRENSPKVPPTQSGIRRIPKSNLRSNSNINKEITHDNLVSFINVKFNKVNQNFKQTESIENKKNIEQSYNKKLIKNKNIPKKTDQTLIYQPHVDEQDFLWETNYKIKMMINNLKNENSQMRSRIGNFQRENQLLQRQWESWKLYTHLYYDAENKPYLDNDTAKLILEDGNFMAITLKRELRALKEKLKNIDEEINQTTSIVEADNEYFLLKNQQSIDLIKKMICDKEKHFIKNSNQNTEILFSKLQNQIEILQRKIYDNQSENSEFNKAISETETSNRQVTEELLLLNNLIIEKENVITQLNQELSQLQDYETNLAHSKAHNHNNNNNAPLTFQNFNEEIEIAIPDELEKRNIQIQHNNDQLNDLTFKIQYSVRKSIMSKQKLLKEIDDQTKKNQELVNNYINLQTIFMKENLQTIPSDEQAIFNTSVKKTEVFSN